MKDEGSHSLVARASCPPEKLGARSTLCGLEARATGCKGEIVKFILAFFLMVLALPLFAFQSVVILPFSNQSNEQQLYWLGEGFAESLSEEMFLKDAHLLQRPERKAVYEELRIPYTGDLSRATMLKLGKKLNANYLVFGSYNLKDKQLSVEARVIRISSSKLSGPIRASGPLDHLYDVQTGIREGLKQYFVSEKIHPAEQQTFANQSVPLHAYEQYIKGLLETTDSERIKFFQRAIDTVPGYTQALYRMGVALERLQRHKESNEFLQRTAFPGPLQSKVDFLSGLNLYSLKDYEGAYQKWLALSKTNPDAEVFNNIGIALMRKNDFQAAPWYLNQAVELDPKNENYHFNLAASYLQEKNDVNAIFHFREAIEYSPSDYQAFYFLAKLLERQQGSAYTQLQEYFQETLPTEQKGKFPEQYTSFVQLLRPAPAFLTREEKQYSELARDQVLKQWSNYVETYQRNAQRYLKEESPEKATFEIRKGISLAPLDWYLHYLWGLALQQEKKKPSAIQRFEFSIWCLDNVESHLELADLYRESERYADAKVHIQQTLALDPKNKKALDLWNKIWNK